MTARRIIVALLAVAGGVAAGFATLVFVVVIGFAVMWMFVFGDDPWPGWAEPALGVVALALGTMAMVLVTWAAFARMTGTTAIDRYRGPDA